MKTPFLNPKLTGPRFDEHTLPLEVLRDFASFQELIVDVARSIYLRENPERQRVPGGFYENFALHLSAIEGGSAIPVIEQVRADGELPIANRFDRARDLVLATIAAVTIGTAIPTEFPRDCLSYFDQFGKSLRADEQIELVVPGQQNVVVYNSAARKKLVLMGAPEYSQFAILRGRITAIDVQKHTYILTLLNQDRVVGDHVPEYTAEVYAAADPNADIRVVVRGLVVFDPNDRPKKIEKISHFEQLDPNDVPARIEELGLLKDGWLDGYGKAPLAQGVRWMVDTWATGFPGDLPSPFVYPTPEGGLQLEWTIDLWELSANIDLATRKAELSSLKIGTEEGVNSVCDLNTPAGWKVLADFIRSCI